MWSIPAWGCSGWGLLSGQVLPTLTAARAVCVALCSIGNQGRQGECAWRLGSGPSCATDHRRASQPPHAVIPCLTSRRDAALHALLGSRQKLVLCWVPSSVSAPEITRNGNKPLPSLQHGSLMHLSPVHGPGGRAVPLGAGRPGCEGSRSCRGSLCPWGHLSLCLGLEASPRS